MQHTNSENYPNKGFSDLTMFLQNALKLLRLSSIQTTEKHPLSLSSQLHLHPPCCRPLEACSPRQMSVRPARRRRTSGLVVHRTADPWSPRRRRRGHGAGPALWLWPAETLHTQTGLVRVSARILWKYSRPTETSGLSVRMQITNHSCHFRPRCICIWESHRWPVCFCFSALQWHRCPTWYGPRLLRPYPGTLTKHRSKLVLLQLQNAKS